MDILNHQFFNGLINLDTFSRLPPNTDIHLSKNTNLFKPNAGKLSGIIGAQTISNMYNDYTPNKLLDDLTSFVHEFVNIIKQLYDIALIDHTQRADVACKLAIANRDFKNAYGNAEKGLQCLLTTYDHKPQLVDIIYCLKTKIDQYKKLTKDWQPIFTGNCPECHFTDDDWEHYIQNSKSLQYETTSLYKFYVQYSPSLLYNQTMNNIGIWHWFDLIHEFPNHTKIYLGGMPLKSGQFSIERRNDLETIKELGVEAILSVVEGFENKSEGYIYTPIHPQEWEPANIKYCQIPIPDFGTVSLDKIHICVEYIDWNVRNGRSVYISCRVGRNRSLFILMAYFVKHLNYKPRDAYEYIRHKRPQAQNKHYKLLQEYEQLIKNKK